MLHFFTILAFLQKQEKDISNLSSNEINNIEFQIKELINEQNIISKVHEIFQGLPITKKEQEEPRKPYQRKNLNLLSISMDLTKKDETEEVVQKLTFIKRKYQNTTNITHLIKQPIKIDGQFYEKSEIENTSDTKIDTKIDTDFYNKTLKWALKRIEKCFEFLKEKEEKIPSLKKIEILKFALGLTTDLYDPKPEDKSNDSQLIFKTHKLLLAKLYKDEKKIDKDEKNLLNYEDEKTSKESFIKLNEWCRINYPAKYQDLNPKPKPSQQKSKYPKI
ncbi:hypothetical protein M0811_10302 [Anaeramoeba ignava]|uniref:Uncharacterized protein n=1 Tax=Anaeramoeba ignava TaxID=1746090 RepID=A0A9Q0RA81_ANAIG|nr:hypothetical protein M0811_10302 [Anaeramoeba ignava]